MDSPPVSEKTKSRAANGILAALKAYFFLLLLAATVYTYVITGFSLTGSVRPDITTSMGWLIAALVLAVPSLIVGGLHSWRGWEPWV